MRLCGHQFVCYSFRKTNENITSQSIYDVKFVLVKSYLAGIMNGPLLPDIVIVASYSNIIGGDHEIPE